MASNLGELFAKGGWVMYPLLICSVLTWAVVIERTIVYLTLRPKIFRLSQSIFQSIKAGDLSAARQLCHGQSPSVGQMFLGTLDTRRTKESAERLTDRNRARLIGTLKKNLWILGTIGSASPFIGLLGTVLGIIRSFHAMNKEGGGGFSVVSGGISEALIATAAGLIVAIIALLSYNIFTTAANQTLSGVKLTLDELIETAFDKPISAAS